LNLLATFSGIVCVLCLISFIVQYFNLLDTVVQEIARFYLTEKVQKVCWYFWIP